MSPCMHPHVTCKSSLSLPHPMNDLGAILLRKEKEDSRLGGGRNEGARGEK